MKVLLAYDGSTHSERALAALEWCGLGGTVDLKVMTVADVEDEPRPGLRAFDGGFAPAPNINPQAIMAAASDVAEQAAKRLREYHPEWQVRALACAGSPVSEIVASARDMRADLIVVGTHGRTALGRLLLGSVSSGVVERAPCTVHIARPLSHARESGLRIVLGYDASENAIAAVEAMRSRTWPAGTEIRLVCALDPLMVSAFGHLIPALPQWIREVNADNMATASAILGAVALGLKREGLTVSTAAREGRPSDVLLQVAKEWQADVIVLGVRGLRGICRLLLGSVSQAVAMHAPCSVEIVRRGTPLLAVESDQAKAARADSPGTAQKGHPVVPTAVTR